MPHSRTAESAEPRINDRIRAREVRLVDPDGNSARDQAPARGTAIARELDLDLVEVAPWPNPPVCRIMDYGKWKYEAAQQAKESRRKSQQHLDQGDEVPAQDRRRRLRHQDPQGDEVPRRGSQGQDHDHVPWPGGRTTPSWASGSSTASPSRWRLAKVEAAPKLDGRNMIMVLAPDRRAKAPGAPGEHGKPTTTATSRPAGAAERHSSTTSAAEATPATQSTPATVAPAPSTAPRLRRPPTPGAADTTTANHHRHPLRPPDGPPTRTAMTGQTDQEELTMPKMKTHRGPPSGSGSPVPARSCVARPTAHHMLEKKSVQAHPAPRAAEELTGGDKAQVKRLLGL